MITQEDKNKATQLIQGIKASLKSLEEIVNKGAIPVYPPTEEQSKENMEELCELIRKTDK